MPSIPAKMKNVMNPVQRQTVCSTKPLRMKSGSFNQLTGSKPSGITNSWLSSPLRPWNTIKNSTAKTDGGVSAGSSNAKVSTGRSRRKVARSRCASQSASGTITTTDASV